MHVAGYDVSQRVPFYYLASPFLPRSCWSSIGCVESRFGIVMRAIAAERERVVAVGIPPWRYQLAAFVVGGTIAGIAGGLLAASQQFISPVDMAWDRSGEFVVMVVLGGLATVWGPVIGAATFLIFELVLSSLTAVGNWLRTAHHRDDRVSARRARRSLGDGRAPHEVRSRVMGDVLLEISGLTKSFAAARRDQWSTPDVRRGETHAIIGPNGAGKTTLIAQLQGMLRSDAGSIRFASADITQRAGLSQGVAGHRPVVPDHLHFPEIHRTGQRRSGGTGAGGPLLPVLAGGGARSALDRPARAAIDRVGLLDRAEIAAENLSHGERRQLEIAMALAMRPTLLLLDEPMAGMSRRDGARMTRLLSDLKQSYTIVLVEHDMDTVFSLADRISVLVAGRTIATGPPEAIRANAEVRAAYLGHKT